MLEAAGLAFIVEPPGLDESAMRQAISGERSLTPHDVAEVLARAKAEAVSDLAPTAYVIGGDQVLALGETILAKPDSMEAARRQLLDLSGKTAHASHRRRRRDQRRDHLGGDDGGDAHHAKAVARVHRPLPRRRRRGGPRARSAPISSKSLGVQLFEQIDGDYFSILGLPLIPLLDTLRREGVIEG